MRAIPGTGLGLTITKLLTQIMGGEINATSTEGHGHHVHGALAAVGSCAAPNSERAAAEGARTIIGYAGPAPQGAADRR